MDANFPDGLNFILAPDNDGSANDDSPGETFHTKWGITEMTWQEAVSRHVVSGDFQKITPGQVRAIYYALYWRGCCCQLLPAGVDVMVFNDAVLTGPATAARLLQRILGATPDGIIGARTLAAVDIFIRNNSLYRLLRFLHWADITYFADLANAPLFIRGWTRRDDECFALAERLAFPAAPSTQGTLI